MRVVEVGKYYYPHKGGIETHLRLLCVSLLGAIDVEAIVFNSGRATVRESVEGVSVTRCGSLMTVASSPVSPLMTWELSKRTYDVLHLHTPNPTAAAAYLASRRQQHSLVVSHHSDIVRQTHLKKLVNPLMRRVLERADAILVASPDYLISSAELRPFKEKCRVVPYGVDLRDFVPDAASRSAARRIRERYSSRIVLCVGRLVYYKGFDIAIEAFQGIEGTLLIVGDGPLLPALQAKVRELHLEQRVVFIGKVEGDLLPYYLAADVFILPSVARSEAFGIVQLEAMACRVPVVNTALESGVPFVSRHGESGLTVPPSDATALGTAIRQLLADASLRKQFGERGRARVEAEFSVGPMSTAILRTYHDVAKGRNVG